jgi:hypothetical protein
MPNINYVRVFGSMCFIRKKGIRVSKFDSKDSEGIFVGYGAESHNYRIYNRCTRRVQESCSVVFGENASAQLGQIDVCGVCR